MLTVQAEARYATGENYIRKVIRIAANKYL